MTEIWNLSAICRCCHLDGNFKSLELEYQRENVVEVYSQMIQETFGLSILKPPKCQSYSICDSCIDKLRDAVNFRDQIIICEEKFKEYLRNEEALNPRHIKVEIELKKDADKIDNKASLSLDTLELDIKQEFDVENDCDDGGFDDVDDTDAVKQEAVKQEESGIKNEIKIEVPSKAKVIKSTIQKPRKKTPKKRIKKDPKEPSAKKKNALQSKTCETCNITFETKKELNIHHNVQHKYRGPFTCVSCPQELELFEDMLQHTNTHGSDTVKCRFCDKHFQVKQLLLEHENSVHIRESVFICDLCNKRFLYRCTLRKHLLWHAGLNKKFFCNLCGNSFNDKTNLKIHVDAVHFNVRKFSCDQCDKTFKANKHLKSHILTKHEGVKDVPYPCKECSAVFSNWRQRQTHVQRCHREKKCDDIGQANSYLYYCKGCPEVFQHRGRFKAHVMKHNKEGSLPHMCHICGLSFSCKYSLNRHVDNHRGVKPHVCEICEKAFSHSSQLVRHKNSIHNPVKKEKIKCPICKNNVRDLEKHNKIHIIRPYTCEQCNKSYPVKNALNRHVREFHLGLYKHCCDICNTKFRNAKYLAKHRKTCSKSFKTDVGYASVLPFSIETENNP